MEQSEFTLHDKIGLVNQLLHDLEPESISKEDNNGYMGYKPQYIIDACNDALGIGSWGFEEISSEFTEQATMVISRVKVWLKDVDFQPVAWGQARVTRGDYGDTRKGAQTDALKKALSYFSIGNRAYQGLLSEKPSNGHKTEAAVKNTLHNNEPSSKQLEDIRRLVNLLGKQVRRPETYEEAHKLHGELAREWNAREQDAKA